MADRNFQQMLEAQWSRGNFVCVGLDSELGKISWSAHCERCSGIGIADKIIAFNQAIVRATKNLVCAYKLNTAFYEVHGAEGMIALQSTIADIHVMAPDVPVILDGKRGDIGNSNTGYAQMAFDHMKADAVTVNPYLGAEALQPFLSRPEKGIIVLCRTSNYGGGEFQNLPIVLRSFQGLATLVGDVSEAETLCKEMNWGYPPSSCRIPLYQYVALRVSRHWNQNGNCALVVGATYPHELRQVRRLVGDMPILIPGIGAQGGDLEKTVSAGKDSRGQGMIINSSRGIIFSNDPCHEAEKLRDLINEYRQEGD